MSQSGTSMGPNSILQKENSPRDGLKKSMKLHFWSTDLVHNIEYSYDIATEGPRIIGLCILAVSL